MEMEAAEEGASDEKELMERKRTYLMKKNALTYWGRWKLSSTPNIIWLSSRLGYHEDANRLSFESGAGLAEGAQ
jgi:hypothetical protein